MNLNTILHFAFILVMTTVTVDTIVPKDSTKENDETLQTIIYEKIHTEDPTTSTKFQTSNARFMFIN